MTDRRVLSLAEIIKTALDRRSSLLRVALPGRIESFNASTQMASVKPLLRDSYEAEDSEDPIVESLPVIHDVPVQFPGAGSAVLTFPVATGDYCLLVFSDRSLDVWLEQGTDVDPIDERRHNLSDAVALLGIRPLPGKLSTFDDTRAYFGKPGGPGIAVGGSEVHLGVNEDEAATDFVALASLVLTELSDIRSHFNTHTHTSAAAGSQTSPPSTAVGVPNLMPAPDSVAAAKTRAK